VNGYKSTSSNRRRTGICLAVIANVVVGVNDVIERRTGNGAAVGGASRLLQEGVVHHEPSNTRPHTTVRGRVTRHHGRLRSTGSRGVGDRIVGVVRVDKTHDPVVIPGGGVVACHTVAVRPTRSRTSEHNSRVGGCGIQVEIVAVDERQAEGGPRFPQSSLTIGQARRPRHGEPRGGSRLSYTAIAPNVPTLE